MAFTVGTIGPIEPYSGAGASKTALTMPVRPTADAAYQKGDVLVMTAGVGTAVIDNSQPAPADIIGVCYEDYTAPSSLVDSDIVTIYPALPNQLWTGNMVTNSTTDEVGFSFTANAINAYDIIEDSVTGFAVLDLSDETGAAATVIGPAREQFRGENMVSDASSGTTNMRVYFVFTDSVFLTPVT